MMGNSKSFPMDSALTGVSTPRSQARSVLLTSVANTRLVQVVHFEHSHDSCAADIRVGIPQTLLNRRHLHIRQPIKASARDEASLRPC